jgi:hypothetical protein
VIYHANIDASHTLVEQRKYTNSANDIRQCRQGIIDLATNDDLNMIKIHQTRDFFNLRNCLVLLFDTKEHRVTLAKIDAALEKLQLRFIGFEIHEKDYIEEFEPEYPNKKDQTSHRLGMVQKQ